MALSYSMSDSPGKKRTKSRRVLVTGAAGNIGSYFAQHSAKKYKLRLMVRPGDEDISKLQRYGEVVIGDLAELDRMKQFCKGIDTVVHLAADPKPGAIWSDLLQANIIGTYNTFVAAKAANCRRVIYASSIHAVSGYPTDMQVKTSDPVNPGDLYGVSKCFGEALARYMAVQEGLSAIAIRIGAFQPIEAARAEGGMDMFDAFVSQRDLIQLIHRCVDDESLQFAIFNGLSDNRFKRLDITDARELVGYSPLDNLAEENPQTRNLKIAKDVPGHNQKGAGTSGIRNEVRKKPR